MIARRDQQYRDQPTFFGGDANSPDEGKQSRDETYREIKDELPDRCRIWLARIIAAGSRGVTLDELSAATGIPVNKFSGRITELKDAHLVRHTSDRRPTRSGSTAAVIRATDKATSEPKHRHQEFPEMSTQTKPANELPDAITNQRIPRDQNGDVITHGARYRVPLVGLVQVHYDVDQDEFYIFRPTSPDKRQPINMLPPQREPWFLIGD